MKFGEAIEALKIGNRVSRPEWAEHEIWLELAPLLVPGDLPQILSIHDGKSIPWPARHEDLFAEDWFIPDQITAHTDDIGAF